MELNIPWAPVKALLNLAGKSDIREHLNGVWIDRRGPRLIIWATTGTVLGAMQTEEPGTEGPDVFIPRHIIEAAAKTFAAQATVRQEEDGRMSISCLGATHYWQDKKPVPPDWRRVVPASTTGIAQQFDARLLGDFLKARKALGQKDHASAVQVAHNGGPTQRADSSAAIVVLRDVPQFVGVVSPIHLDDKGSPLTDTRPDWVGALGQQATAPVEDLV